MKRYYDVNLYEYDCSIKNAIRSFNFAAIAALLAAKEVYVNSLRNKGIYA